MMISIGRLASFRFRSPEDIAGSELTIGTDHARILQALLQNTLEQSLLLILVYSAWAMWVPAQWLEVLPLTSILFLLGRILFFVRYEDGAPARALGFTLTFYPTVLLLLIFLGWSVASALLKT